jgi:carboxyl-terminal processing protease
LAGTCKVPLSGSEEVVTNLMKKDLRSINRIMLLLGVVLVFSLPLFAQETDGQQTEEDDLSLGFSVQDVLADFDAVWQLIAESYVDEGYDGVDWEALREQYRPQVEIASDARSAYQMLTEMVAQLPSPNTLVIPPWLRSDLESESSDVLLEYGGVGILLQQLEGGDVMVLQVFRDTPAEAADVLVGDVIVGVNDWRVGGENPVSAIADRVRGPVDTDVQLTLRDPDGVERTVEITRAQIDLRPSVEHRLIEGTIGYLRIPVLSKELVEVGTKALPQLLSASGMILDLRSVSRGSFEEMAQIVQWFLGAGHLGGFLSREGAFALPSRQDAIAAFQRPVVILTNPRTYGIAEVMAFILSEYKRGKIVGNQTAGAYELGRPVDLPSGGLLQVTIGRYISPQGTLLPPEGLPPDVEVEFPDLATVRSGRDVYIEQAVEVLRNPKRW